MGLGNWQEANAELEEISPAMRAHLETLRMWCGVYAMAKKWDVADSVKNLNELLKQIGNSPNEYFAVFVNAIIEREAKEKWIDTSGEAAKPLFSGKDHFDLLSAIAQEMWMLSTDSVKAEVLDLLADLFCDARRLPPAVAFQIKERTKQHALIVGAGGTQPTFSFDHEEFKNFFLGEAIGRLCAEGTAKQKSEVLGLLRKGNLPAQATEAAISVVRRTKGASMIGATEFLQEMALMDGPSSFTQENAARMMNKMLQDVQGEPVRLGGLGFGTNALGDLHLSEITFAGCSFGATSRENTVLKDCSFENCRFERLDLHASAKISGTTMVGADIGSVVLPGRGEAVFNPGAFPTLLRQAGFTVPTKPAVPQGMMERKEDPDVKLFRRLVRCFQFRTHKNENVVLRKMGPGAETFVRNTVPKLVKGNVLSEEWIARDKQHRYHLGMSMERVQAALGRAGTTIDEFLKEVSGSAS